MKKGYRASTIAHFISMGKAAIAALMLIINALHVCITNGNRKIGRFLNVSLLPIFSCGTACKVCKGICYDIKACLQYTNVLHARARNYVLALYDREKYFAEIITRIGKRDRSGRGRKGFRWHVGGDILDMDYLIRMIEIAKLFPNWRFWTYTKQYMIVNSYIADHGKDREIAIPSNLNIMFSEWDGLPLYNPYNFPTFRCILKGKSRPQQSYEMKCPGNCELCYDGKTGCPYGKSACADEH